MVPPVKKPSSSSSSALVPETRRKPPPPKTKLFFLFISLVLFALVSLKFSRDVIMSGTDLRFLPTNLTILSNYNTDSINHVVREEAVVVVEEEEVNRRRSRHVSSIQEADKYKSVSVLMPAWEILVIVSPETPLLVSDSVVVDGFVCLFSTNQTSPARFSGVLPFTNQTTFKCIMPNKVRRFRPFLQPVLTKYPEKESLPKESTTEELIRFNFFVYESISTENDVVLLVKGVNNRQGINRPPHEFKCVFGNDVSTAVKTPVTSSIQEVFRCPHPDNLTASSTTHPIKVSLEISIENQKLVSSIAYYTPKRKLAEEEKEKSKPKPKSQLCACTMVYNVAKYLREWVIYHSKIGVEKFILYDNDSDDDLKDVVKELNQEGYNVTTLLWLWPKTQEAGFSHNAIYSKDSCKWMMYIDVDEFVFVPSWANSSQPSDNMLKSLLPKQNSSIGQVSIRCNDFGPSGQVSHPVEGVTQGYNCHRWSDQQRHKSIVSLDAIGDSLLNVVHHFGLKEGYSWKQVGMDNVVVNHYKFQAWSEFKTKFRRRVSAYVVDWRENVNPMSKDRTPGLGFEPVEPEGWSQMFCDAKDDRLKLLTRKWFGNETPTGFKMAWQRL